MVQTFGGGAEVEKGGFPFILSHSTPPQPSSWHDPGLLRHNPIVSPNQANAGHTGERTVLQNTPTG